MKTTVFATLGVALSFAAAADAAPLTIDLTGVVRDFRPVQVVPGGHPDFQRAIDGLQTGKVKPTLDADHKPVFIGGSAENVGSFTNQANFSQWYRDTPGVNLSKNHTISLEETAPGSGLFEFSSNAFFPIDGQLFGNEGQAHNYHFTYELNSIAALKQGDTFSFTGDDDLWVFIDKKLVVDLGGVKTAQTAGFTVDNAFLATYGLATGTNYAFDIFFAERHTTESNFAITTSIALETTPIPVPAALPLLGSALAGLGLLRRRRRA
jgi:fibro-slime domain-containing protein